MTAQLDHGLNAAMAYSQEATGKAGRFRVKIVLAGSADGRARGTQLEGWTAALSLVRVRGGTA
jgi:hypothetical protein